MTLIDLLFTKTRAGVADIEEVLNDKLDMSKAEALELLAVLDNISNTTIYDINQVNQRNRERLAKLSARVGIVVTCSGVTRVGVITLETKVL